VLRAGGCLLLLAHDTYELEADFGIGRNRPLAGASGVDVRAVAVATAALTMTAVFVLIDIGESSEERKSTAQRR
jgi:hypothetical protein